MIDVKKAVEYSEQELENFIGEKPNLEVLYEHGYYVEVNDDKKGFFALVPVDEQAVWLRALYVDPKMNAHFILTLFEVIPSYKGNRDVYVFCHQDELETLLQAQQFTKIKREETPPFLQALRNGKGDWWKW
ncbi:hypothetical protein [Pontibacillus litoralis]|uniref:Uncharacterized protein n=1 Tax=Pontibacillus litoralis JSM 072002 TaxID=1385512 RepID=A0A0A5HS55_9BACI|nr:hypothetical protein [Pontibacillus litoralis]KGX86457.1 hypothetical protein N784_04700 [Pontibacillus litoralis JSM 072002]